MASDMEDYEGSPRPPRDSYPQPRGRRALATVYDATAGRVTSRKVFQDEDDGQFGDQQRRPSQPAIEVSDQDDHQPAVLGRLKLAPEEVLFRRKDAPVRYEEFDIYRSHERDLPHSGRGVLPESDLLRAIHAYSSRFYAALSASASASASDSAAWAPQRNVDECSMDETALLAFGVLLEEAGREVLGSRGHVVFTEAATDGPGGAETEAEPEAQSQLNNGSSSSISSISMRSSGGNVPMGNAGVGSSSRRSGAKRRRVTKGDDT